MDAAALLHFAMREAALLAACGFLLLGIGDLAVDLVWIVRALLRRDRAVSVETLEEAERPGLLAVFIPAWDESAVIGNMLRNTLTQFGEGDYRLYVGCYPNDPATIAAVRAVADPRVRLVIGTAPGGTTKADCLNRLWEALLADERADGRQAKAIVLHDAEDVVHSAELRIFDRLIESHEMVQLPVLPLIDEHTSAVSAVYGDEFAESHGKELVVRQALGASIPSAGVGCAFSRAALAAVADRSGGLPFDANSLTEDYELGLKLHAAGARTCFVRLRSGSEQALVATKEYFPGTMKEAADQKARWMTGIALLGWDKLGWCGGIAERWMRLRDRQSILAALLLLAGYFASLLWVLWGLWELAGGASRPQFTATVTALLQVNFGFLLWRLAMRFGFVASCYGWWHALVAVPRTILGNWIAMRAAAKSVGLYLSVRRGGAARWDKTAHAFPAEVPAE